MKSVACIAVLLAFTAAPLLGTDATVEFSGTAPNVTVATTGLTNNGNSLATSTTFALAITCINGADCTQVEVDLNGSRQSLTDAGGEELELMLALAGNQLSITYAGTERITTTIAVEQPDDTNGAAPEEVPLNKLLQNPCTEVRGPVPTPGYSREANLSVRTVDITGRLLSPAQENMDEDDTLELYVLVDSQLAPLVNARRTSAIRTVGSLQIIGQGVTITLPESLAQGVGPGPCEFRKFTLDSFAPGEGEVEIRVSQGTAQPLTVGNHEFLVHKLYDGMFSFGALRSDLVDRKFKLATQGEDKILYASENGSHETLYAVFYTPFVWGKRDIEKSVPNRLHRLNPTFGVAISNFSENALAGATYDLPRGLLLVGGIHLSRVTDLTGGVTEGPFEGEEADIPTKKEWDHGAFFGISIDLRAASQLLETVFGGGDD